MGNREADAAIHEFLHHTLIYTSVRLSTPLVASSFIC